MLAEFLHRIYRGLRYPEGRFKAEALTAADIENERYRDRFGGGAEKWERFGAFQLSFLREMGLRPSHKLLDIGCGPIRGGVHFIRYLEEGRYFGMDYNPDFLCAAEHLVAREPELAAKRPRFLERFDFDRLETNFDFAVAFAVFMHCNRAQRRHLLESAERALEPGGRFYATHADNFDASELRGSSLRLTRRIEREEDVCRSPEVPDWVRTYDRRNLYPIVELTRGSSDPTSSR